MKKEYHFKKFLITNLVSKESFHCSAETEESALGILGWKEDECKGGCKSKYSVEVLGEDAFEYDPDEERNTVPAYEEGDRVQVVDSPYSEGVVHEIWNGLYSVPYYERVQFNPYRIAVLLDGYRLLSFFRVHQLAKVDTKPIA